MNIVFVDDGSSNRTLMAMSICHYMLKKSKNKKLKKADFILAATDKTKNMHAKAIKALEEFGSEMEIYTQKAIKNINEIAISGKTVFIILGQDNQKKKIKKVAEECESGTVKIWAIENPLLECRNEVKLRFYRRTRDQLWVRLESFIKEFD